MNIQNLYLTMFIYYLAITASESWRPYVFQIKKFSTESFSTVIGINSSVTNNKVSLYVNVRENLPNLYSKVVLKFASTTTNEVYDMEFINRTIDYCEFFRNKRYEPVLQIFYRMFATGTDMARSCPIKKKLYFIKNRALDAESFPPVMPNKKGFLDSYLLVKNGKEMNIIGRCVFYFEFKNLNIEGRR